MKRHYNRKDDFEDDNKGCTIKVGGGCFTLLLEIVAFVLICNIFGCTWAENAVNRVVTQIKTLCK